MDILITLLIVGILIYVFFYMRGKGVKARDESREKRQEYSSPKTTGSRGTRYAKWIGGGLGWAFGGPIGAILGFALGSMYEGMNGDSRSYAPGQSKTRRGDFSVSLLVLAAAVMKADQRVMRSELDYVKQFLVRQFGQDAAAEQILVLRELLKQDINLQEVGAQIKTYMDYASRLQLLHFLFGISSADGQFHPREVETIEVISGYLGISNNDYLSIKSMFVKDTTSAYKIMEVSPDATDEEIKKAYKKMAVKYHPDKVSHLGEDVQKAAKEKFQTLQDAYDKIKKERDIR